MFLLDTDVLVECLRGRVAARDWLASAPGAESGIPGVVAMELLMGCRNQSDLRQVQKFVTQFAILWPAASEFALPCDLMVAHRLASGLGIPDCLIAAMALSRHATLYTFN